MWWKWAWWKWASLGGCTLTTRASHGTNEALMVGNCWNRTNCFEIYRSATVWVWMVKWTPLADIIIPKKIIDYCMYTEKTVGHGRLSIMLHIHTAWYWMILTKWIRDEHAALQGPRTSWPWPASPCPSPAPSLRSPTRTSSWGTSKRSQHLGRVERCGKMMIVDFMFMNHHESQVADSKPPL